MNGRMIAMAVFSLVVLGGYAAANVMAVDPFAASSDVRELPPDVHPAHQGGSGGSAVFWYGGFSGGK